MLTLWLERDSYLDHGYVELGILPVAGSKDTYEYVPRASADFYGPVVYLAATLAA